MKKSELEYGNVVETRIGNKYLYHFTTCDKLLNLTTNNSYLEFYVFDKDLTHYHNAFDIMKVYKDYTCEVLLWERKEKPQLTEDEKVILKNVPKHYEWIARDNDGHLYIYASEPEKGLTIWKSCGLSMASFDHLFQFIKWENDEPYSIKELLKEEE